MNGNASGDRFSGKRRNDQHPRRRRDCDWDRHVYVFCVTIAMMLLGLNGCPRSLR